MIVRLKEPHELRNVRRNTWFQFYDSPIKRKITFREKETFIKFQFYDSPIKRNQHRRALR